MKVVHPSVKAQCNCVVPRSVILRAMFGPLPIFFFLGGGGGAFEIFEGHILPSVKHNPIRFFYKSWTCPYKLALKFREKWLLSPVQIGRSFRK